MQAYTVQKPEKLAGERVPFVLVWFGFFLFSVHLCLYRRDDSYLA